MTTLKDYPSCEKCDANYIDDEWREAWSLAFCQNSKCKRMRKSGECPKDKWKKEFKKELRELFEFEWKEAKGFGRTMLVVQHIKKRVLGEF